MGPKVSTTRENIDIMTLISMTFEQLGNFV